jgi:hypothetical protein
MQSLSRILFIFLVLFCSHWLTASATAQFPQKRPPPTAEEVERSRTMHVAQAELLAEWDKGKVDPLDSKDLLKIISSISDDSKIDVPDNGTKVDLNSLPAEIQTDLHNAIAGLIRAYCSELQTTAIIAYMKDRNEKINVAELDSMRSSVHKRLTAVTIEDLKAMPDDDLFRLYYGDDIQSNWAGLQPKESCVQVWKTSKRLTQEAIQDFGKEYWKVFPSISILPHWFSPKTSFNDQLENTGSVLIADIKLLIRFDEKLNNTPAPYFIRFWFCTADKKWHPIQLVRCRLPGQSLLISKIVF